MSAIDQITRSKIILVERDRQLAARMVNTLQELDYIVDGVFHDVDSAFAAFNALNFSMYHPLVILDGNLEKNGSEVIARFLANKGIRFILHTDRELASDDGFQNMEFEVLSKSGERSSLMSVLARY